MKGTQKIGVVTQYYESINCGGLLQAYALIQTLNYLGYEAEQIKFVPKVERGTLKQKIKKLFKLFPFKIFKRIFVKLQSRIKYNYKKNERLLVFRKRKETTDKFYNLIPHSEKVYNLDTIDESLNIYGIFITGSDQVWNPKWYGPTISPIYFLDFVPKGIPKFSYAASVSATKIPKEQENIYRKSLKDYLGVSVREQDTVALLKQYCETEPVCSLDPTLLLTKQDWDEVCDDSIIEEPYIFCYFLGEDKSIRKLAKKFADAKKLKIVAFPHLSGSFSRDDIMYTDIKIEDSCPEKFISLIKNAEYIITNSFHACVFSQIYKKQFFVFNRAGFKGMSVRITSLTDIFNSESRMCTTKERKNLEYMLNLSPLIYDDKKYLQLKEKSLLYIREMLNKAEQIRGTNES